LSSFHTILLSWSSQQKVIYALDECVAMLVGQESLQVRCQGSPKDSGRVFEALWQPSPSQLSLLSNTRTFPLEGKDGLALWGQADAKNASLRSRQVKNFTSLGIRPKIMYRFGTTRYKVTVAELTARRF
jgi:hypothetical protein